MEAEVVDSFELFKGVGILASLVLVVAFQLLFPNRLTLRTVVSNWTANCPLALIDAALLSLLCGACVCTWAVTVRAHGIGIFTAISLPYWVQVGTTVVLLDLVAYLWHRANHRWRTL